MTVTDRDSNGWPVRMLDGVRVCARPNCRNGPFVGVPSEEWRISGYCSYDCGLLHEGEEQIEQKDARIAELQRERDSLEHHVELIRADVEEFRTDCSTPEFQMVRNMRAELIRLRAALEPRGLGEDEGEKEHAREVKGPLGRVSIVINQRKDRTTMRSLLVCLTILALASSASAGVPGGARYCDEGGTTTVDVYACAGQTGYVVQLSHANGSSQEHGYPTPGTATPNTDPVEIERTSGAGISMGDDWYRISDGKLQKLDNDTDDGDPASGAWEDLARKKPPKKKRTGGSNPDPDPGSDADEQEVPPPPPPRASGGRFTGGEMGSLPVWGDGPHTDRPVF